MKKLLLAGALFLSINLFSQDYTVNYESPISVVKAIFHAAETGEHEILGTLCDPLAKGDSDVKNICSMGFGFSDADKKKLEEKGSSVEEVKGELQSLGTSRV